MTPSLSELASALGLAFGLLGMIFGALVSRRHFGATFGGGTIGALSGFWLAVKMAGDNDGAAKAVPTVHLTKTYTYSYHYFTHTDWAWLISAPLVALIVVFGALAAYWMRLRYGAAPVGSGQQQLRRHHPASHRGELVVIPARKPPSKRNPFEDWR
jgi:hypothetical protein